MDTLLMGWVELLAMHSFLLTQTEQVKFIWMQKRSGHSDSQVRHAHRHTHFRLWILLDYNVCFVCRQLLKAQMRSPCWCMSSVMLLDSLTLQRGGPLWGHITRGPWETHSISAWDFQTASTSLLSMVTPTKLHKKYSGLLVDVYWEVLLFVCQSIHPSIHPVIK